MCKQPGMKNAFKLQKCPLPGDGTEKLVAVSSEMKLFSDLPGCLKRQEREL